MAGASMKDIKSRIHSVESTRQITKAMEMVAASKLRHAQNRVSASRPYFEIFHKTINQIVATNKDFSSPFLNAREGNKVLFIVIAGDRGLAGGYNSNILKLCMAQMEGKDATVLPIGKKSVDYFRHHGVKIFTDNYAETAEVSIGDCFSISRAVAKAFLEGQFDEVRIGYTTFVSVLSQTPTSLPLLPLVKDESFVPENDKMDTLYEPGAEEVFQAIVPEYLGGILYGAICEAQASEQAARRTAMDSATSNAEEMIADLSLKYNRARQAAITQEITEIVAGAEA